MNDKEEITLELESDPFVGSQQTTDSPVEAQATPDIEVVLEQPPVGQPVKSRGIAAALGILLGGFGAHRFYLGYTRIGLAQLALTAGSLLVSGTVALVTGASATGSLAVGAGTAALGMLWGMFEGVAILVGGMPRDAAHHPLRNQPGYEHDPYFPSKTGDRPVVMS